MSAAWLVVRATVADAADRPAFDAWYQNEHLPDAVKAFGVRTAWRGWSQQDPAVHCAYYRFDSPEVLSSVMGGQAIKDLIGEFDRCWGDKVTRSREVFAIAHEVP